MILRYFFGILLVYSFFVPGFLYPEDGDRVFEYTRALPTSMLAAAISAGFAFFIPKADRGKAKMYFFPTLLGVLFLALMVWGRT
jgi:hypothetical protein